MKNLTKDNASKRIFILNKLTLLNDELNKVSDFTSVITKKENPQDFFAFLILKKVYALNICVNNAVCNNDTFTSVYLYRYLYEMYIKVSYTLSPKNKEKTDERIQEFFNNKKNNIPELLKLTEKNRFDLEVEKMYDADHYTRMSRMAHPNVDSCNMHFNTTPDREFDFIMTNVNLSVQFILATITQLKKYNFLSINEKIDFDNFKRLSNEIINYR